MASAGRNSDTTIGLKGPLRKDVQYNRLTSILIGQDILYGAPGEVADIDLPVPLRLMQRPQPLLLQNLQGLLSVANPFAIQDFRVVRRPSRLLQDLVVASILERQTDQDLPPGLQLMVYMA